MNTPLLNSLIKVARVHKSVGETEEARREASEVEQKLIRVREQGGGLEVLCAPKRMTKGRARASRK